MAQNWVERRVRREHLLSESPARIWSDVCAAIENTVDSLKRHYHTEVTTERKNGQLLQIKCKMPDTAPSDYRGKELLIDIHLNVAKRMIEVSCAEPCRSESFSIEADDQNAFITLGKDRISPDGLSERVLKNVVFPGDVPRLGLVEYWKEQGRY